MVSRIRGPRSEKLRSEGTRRLRLKGKRSEDGVKEAGGLAFLV